VIENYRKAIEFLIKDLSSKSPVLINCLFTVDELLEWAKIVLEHDKKLYFVENLHKMHVVSKTDKRSAFGFYYNVSRRLYRRFRKNKEDKKWLGVERSLKSGFCILNTPIQNYRMMCKGKGCKFFLTTENACVKERVFFGK
jgi:hypothetical protein